MARLTQIDRKHQFLTFTDISLVSLTAKKQQETDYQDLLMGTLGHEKLTRLNQIIGYSKTAEKQLAEFSRHKKLLALDNGDGNRVRELRTPRPMTEEEAFEMQELVAHVWSSGNIMLYMTNS